MNRQGPAGRYNNVSTGYSTGGANSQAKQLNTLKCGFCEKDKPLDAFTETQIKKATFNPYAPYAGTTTIRCKQCSPSLNTHLTCMICSKKMLLDKFAKTQRRNAERARCRKCVEANADFSDSDTDEEEDFF